MKKFVNDEFEVTPDTLNELQDTIQVRKSNLEFQIDFFTTRFSNGEDIE